MQVINTTLLTRLIERLVTVYESLSNELYMTRVKKKNTHAQQVYDIAEKCSKIEFQRLL